MFDNLRVCTNLFSGHSLAGSCRLAQRCQPTSTQRGTNWSFQPKVQGKRRRKVQHPTQVANHSLCSLSAYRNTHTHLHASTQYMWQTSGLHTPVGQPSPPCPQRTTASQASHEAWWWERWPPLPGWSAVRCARPPPLAHSGCGLSALLVAGVRDPDHTTFRRRASGQVYEVHTIETERR